MSEENGLICAYRYDGKGGGTGGLVLLGFVEYTLFKRLRWI